MTKYENFCLALSNLETGVALGAPEDVRQLTGLVGLHHICFELSWKLMRHVLLQHGEAEEALGSPRSVIRAAWHWNIISDEGTWLDLLRNRNVLTHTYDEEAALAVIEKIKSSYLQAFRDLKRQVGEKWL